MRVVAGELRGRRLQAPRGEVVRPTSDRVREALFSVLGEVEGLRVLDLFCGTGALAIEALSRGAEHATLVDIDTAPASRNVRDLGLGDRAELVRRDASEYLRGADGAFGLILCDPPYTLAARLEEDLANNLQRHLAPGGRVVVESSAREPLDLGSALERAFERRYGDTLLRIWKEPQ